MSVTALSGLVDDADILADERVVDMDDVIAMLDPQVSQFTTMLMRVASRQARNSKVEWLEDELFPRLSAVVSGGATDGANIVVTSGEGQYFRAGDVIRNAKTGVAAVVSSVATDTLSVGNAIGAVAFAAHTAGDQLVIIGNASAQGAASGTRKVVKRVMNYNYTQIQRNPYGFTNTLIESELYTSGEPGYERKKKLIEHKRAIEQILFWGARSLDTSGSEPVGYSGGAVEFLSTNVTASIGTLTAANLDGYLQDMLQHGSQNKVFFVAPTVAAAMSGFLRGAWSPVDVKARLWGAKVDALISGAYGYQIPVVVKREWNDFSTASNQYGGWAFLIDMNYVKIRPLRNRNTKLIRNIQDNDADRYDEEYLTEFALEFQQERCHGLLKGITG